MQGKIERKSRAYSKYVSILSSISTRQCALQCDLEQVLRCVKQTGTSVLLLGSIAAGSAIGYSLPSTGQWLSEQIDAMLLALITLLFFSVRFDAIVRALGNLRFITVVLAVNFVLVPLLGYAIATLLLPAYPLFMVGLMIYFMSPCTDWFLGFTRLAKGNVALGTALIPINMVMQLLLYPLYLYLFTRNVVQVDSNVIGSTLLQWFLMPLAIATLVHYSLRLLLNKGQFERLLTWVDRCALWLIALLVAAIFAANIAVILENYMIFGWLLPAVLLFFIATFVLSERLSCLFRFSPPEHALLTMVIAARNAPLMLAITMTVLPDQPLIHAAIVIGMLMEFPHLTLLQRLLLNRQSSLTDQMPIPLTQIDLHKEQELIP
jgi:ACR3 family arsenite transporter